MNISDIRDEIKSLVNKEIMLKVSGSRAKTTMMKGIVNEVYSNIFTVLVDGVNVKNYSLEELHNKLGYIPQKAVMFTGTVKSNVAYADVAIGDVCIYHM